LNNTPEKILIIDDDQLRKSFIKLLTNEGYESGDCGQGA
jgi:hypothetical protein